MSINMTQNKEYCEMSNIHTNTNEKDVTIKNLIRNGIKDKIN
jgi:hypothetical protein